MVTTFTGFYGSHISKELRIMILNGRTYTGHLSKAQDFNLVYPSTENTVLVCPRQAKGVAKLITDDCNKTR